MWTRAQSAINQQGCQPSNLNRCCTYTLSPPGKKTADRLDIEGRRKELWRIQTKVNMVYFEGKGTTFISYKNPFDSVLGEVAEELPPYV